MKYWLIFASFVIGLNIGWQDYPKNVWDRDRGGLDSLNEQMKADKSERLAIAVITQNKVYAIQAVDPNKYKLSVGFVERQ